VWVFGSIMNTTVLGYPAKINDGRVTEEDF